MDHSNPQQVLLIVKQAEKEIRAEHKQTVAVIRASLTETVQGIESLQPLVERMEVRYGQSSNSAESNRLLVARDALAQLQQRKADRDEQLLECNAQLGQAQAACNQLRAEYDELIEFEAIAGGLELNIRLQKEDLDLEGRVYRLTTTCQTVFGMFTAMSRNVRNEPGISVPTTETILQLH